MTLALSQDTLDYYAREADRKARGMQAYGGNPELVKLRCFKYYHPETGSFLTDPGGRDRWVGPKTSRVYAILRRIAGSGERMTMKDIASEALCCSSTVSRAVTRIQSWGMLAVDVTRGRNGGIVVRLPAVVPAMRHYIAAAWRRIRAWINVASTSRGREGDPKLVTGNPISTMDATFSREARLELAGARILSGESSIDEARALVGHHRERPTDADREWERAQEWARRVIAERRRLDERFPDWDLELEKVRDSLGIG